MAKESFEAQMAGLEKAQGQPEKILEEAASILGLDLEATIAQGATDPIFEASPASHGFKEQWVLRWLLKRLGALDKAKNGESKIGASQKSFILSPKFWSLLLNLICSIPGDVCSDILLERDFPRLLVGFNRELLSLETRLSPIAMEDNDLENGGRPAKRRCLSPLVDDPSAVLSQQKLLWLALQTGSRCVGSSSTSSTPPRSATRTPLTKTASRTDHSALLGSLLELVACILDQSIGTPDPSLISTILETLLSSWDALAPTFQKKADVQDEAFSSHCLLPCLRLVDILARPKFSQGPFAQSRAALERLIALHVVFPLRALFNEQFTKKWRAVTDILLFEHMETLLKAYNNLIICAETENSQQYGPNSVLGIKEFSWIILDVAVRSMPVLDFRRRQQEQPYIDSLFIWLVHITWPRIPHITSTGVLQPPPPPLGSIAGVEDTWAQSTERLIEVAHKRKLQLGLQIITYVLQAMLATDTELAPWSLLATTIHLDVNILVSHSRLSTSTTLLEQVLDRIESSTVSETAYDLVRDQIIRPLLRSFARSRDLDSFVIGWQRMLAEAIRVRYTSRHDQQDCSAVLAWEDEDVFDEFKPLVAVYAPPNMDQRMLEGLIEPIAEIADKVGSTAEVFARLAIFCTILESPSSEVRNPGFDQHQLVVLLHGAKNALSRRSDYQGQRWRLWRVIGLVVQSLDGKALPADLESLLDFANHFVSLQDIRSFQEADTGKHVARYLECLECFSLLVQLASQSKQYQQRLESEASHLADLLQRLNQDRVILWDGRRSKCNNVHDLVAACVGRLLKSSKLFSMYAESFGAFIQACLEKVFQPLQQDSTSDALPALHDLLLAVLEVEDISRTPALRRLIFECIDKNLWSTNRSRKVCMRLLHRLSMEKLSKPMIKNFVASTLRRLFDEPKQAKIETISGDLHLLTWLDSTFPGAFIDYREWRKWIDFVVVVLQCDDGESSQVKLTDSQTYVSSYVTAGRILAQVFQSSLIRNLTVSKSSATEALAYLVMTVQKQKARRNGSVPLSCLRIFFDSAYRLGSALDGEHQRKDVEFLQAALVACVREESDKALPDAANSANLLRLQPIVDALQSLEKAGQTDELRDIVSAIQEKLVHIEAYTGQEYAVRQSWRMELSLRRQCTNSPFAPQKRHVQELSSLITPLATYTNESAAALAAEAEIFVCQLEPASWPATLEFFLKKSEQVECQPACAVFMACILGRIKTQHIVRYPTLAQALAQVVCMNTATTRLSTTGLLLALENCKSALELHPMVVNQSVLDRLLASLHAVASAEPNGARSLQIRDRDTGPTPADIYRRICGVIGAILGRHRRRLTDRYHLLLPILQSLLRCLFWPGQRALESHRGSSANAMRSFGRSMPTWLHESAESLPQSSAEQFARLLSSISNPTVSAARLSNKRGHNELNDVVNRARKLAGQHMQYLVMEYCRCVLDGQINPSTKDQLMPGMYRVMDALDRDVMRAMNAGLDPSSRTIFKGLYDSWVRYGKWNKG
ncbi:hypothetical protein AYO21_07838 [Fonsecaea monophora]|uniref:Nucleolar 27S pre-rRNA processing Urb2/Npa2 C-terminal domain-containing protein n=1 Tax=Fonsecaea monophora TaxID=254056 RepID=A0A177F173_9EURO|nr:hypothetical protein AYO21_07838 [Fonsecaea monophora]KAH0848740.1 hypothetical protein FOPE_02986 [Fonsecaea pedrosoi]OAG37988.1 hypothetical protein AYO21_07838 [Fonsecaea monophora]